MSGRQRRGTGVADGTGVRERRGLDVPRVMLVFAGVPGFLALPCRNHFQPREPKQVRSGGEIEEASTAWLPDQRLNGKLLLSMLKARRGRRRRDRVYFALC